MPQLEYLTRSEFEERMNRLQTLAHMEFAAMRAEFKDAQDRQDEEWNKGFRAIREDQQRAFDSLQTNIRQDLRNFVTTDVFVARLNPVQSVAYGIVALMVMLVAGMLASALMFRVKG